MAKDKLFLLRVFRFYVWESLPPRLIKTHGRFVLVKVIIAEYAYEAGQYREEMLPMVDPTPQASPATSLSIRALFSGAHKTVVQRVALRDDASSYDRGLPAGLLTDYLSQDPSGLGQSSITAGSRRPRKDFDPLRPALALRDKNGVFDAAKARNKLIASCQDSPGGRCLAHVEPAMAAGGFNIVSKMRDRHGTHWAKDLAPALKHDGRFSEVAHGHGAHLKGPYRPEVGDIAVWTGGRFGHTQMFIGWDKTGHQVWMSDFRTNPTNWTGLANPNSHGDVKIFRQKPKESPVMMVNVGSRTKPRPGGNSTTDHTTAEQMGQA